MLHRRKFYISIAFALLSFNLGSVHSAEEDVLLLSFDGDLIGPLQPLGDGIDNPQQAARVIRDYHQLLSDQVKAEVDSLHRQMLRLVPDFEVAYTAADSAEITQVMSDIDLRLAAIQLIHRQQYTQDVIDLLNEAYQMILPTFGDPQ